MYVHDYLDLTTQNQYLIQDVEPNNNLKKMEKKRKRRKKMKRKKIAEEKEKKTMKRKDILEIFKKMVIFIDFFSFYYTDRK